MTDLLERLSYSSCGLCCEAHAEIERLTKERDFAIAAHDGQVQDKDYLAGEVSRRLRAALEEIIELNWRDGLGKAKNVARAAIDRR